MNDLKYQSYPADLFTITLFLRSAKMILDVYYVEDGDNEEVTCYEAQHAASSDLPTSRRKETLENVWETFIARYDVRLLEEHEEVSDVLANLRDAEDIPETAFCMTWPHHGTLREENGKTTTFVYIITELNGEIKATVIERCNRREIDVKGKILQEDGLFIVGEAGNQLDALCLHSAMRKDLFSFLEYLLKKGYLAAKQAGKL